MKPTLLILTLILISSTLFPQSFEIRTGLFWHDSGTIWGNSKKEYGVDFGFEVIFGDGLLRPNVGFTINSQGHTSKIYGGYILEPRINNLFISLGLGAAFHSGEIHSKEVKSLGSKLLFRISIEIGFDNISVILDHISNATLARYNDGLDILGIRYGWRF